jgi:hypothetical protein
MRKESQAGIVARQEVLRRGLASEDVLDGPITKALIDKAHSQLIDYWSLSRPLELDEAITLPARQAESRAVIEENRARTFWKNPTADVQHKDEYSKAGDIFADSHPQFIQIRANLQAMGLELAKQNLNPTIDNLNKAFTDLCLAGKLFIAPENVNAGPEDEVTGFRLIHHPNLHKLLQSYAPVAEVDAERARIEHLSADEYRAEFLSENDGKQPPIIQRNIDITNATFNAHHPEFIGTEENISLLVGYLRENNLPYTYNSLEAAFGTCKDQLELAASTTFRHGISTLHIAPPALAPTENRPVVIREPSTAKRFSMREILSWDAATLVKMCNENPGLREAIDAGNI